MKLRVVLALCLACIVAGALFVTCHAVSLTRRVDRLEATVMNVAQAPIRTEVLAAPPRELAVPTDGAELEGSVSHRRRHDCD